MLKYVQAFVTKWEKCNQARQAPANLDEIRRKYAKFAGEAVVARLLVSLPPSVLHLAQAVNNLANLQV